MMLAILLITMVLISFFAIYTCKVIYNPVTMYNGIWLFVISLYQLRLSAFQDPLTEKGLVLITISVLFFNVGFYFKFTNTYLIQSILKKYKKYKKHIEINKEDVFFNSKFIMRMFYIWLIIEIFEVIYSGGMPIFWIYTGNPKTYFEFGIHTLHGFANSFGLVITTISFYYIRFVSNKNRKIKLIVLFFLLFHVFALSRQVVISCVLQMFIIYIFSLKKIYWKTSIFAAILGVTAFGMLGNVRTGYDGFLSVAGIETNINKYFIGIYWVYMYLTMTIANLNSIANLTFTHTGLNAAVGSLIPSVLRSRVLGNVVIPDFQVTQAFNVSGYFVGFYIGFGYAGVAFIAFIYGFIGAYLFGKLKINKNNKYILYYVVYGHIILLSFFSDLLLYMPTGFQFVIIFALYKYLNHLKHKNKYS